MHFIFGKPIDEPFDREEEIETLTKLILRLQPTSIIGLRRVGKTSIILKVLKEVKYPKVYISVEDFVKGKSFDFDSFLEYYASLLLAETLKFMDPKVKIPFLLKMKGQEIEKTLRDILGYLKISLNMNVASVEVFLDSLKKGGMRESVMELIDLPQQMAERIGNKIVIVFDEFQYLKLAEQNYPGLFHLLRSKWQFHRDVEYVVSGSSVGMLEDLLYSKDQPFYQFFYSYYVNPFDRDTAIKFLREGFKQEGKEFDDDALKMAFDELDGLPAWLNYFGLKALDCKRVNKECVDKILKGLSNDSMIMGLVEEELNKLGKNAREVLLFLAKRGGKGRLRGIELTRSSVNEGIKSLLRYGYVKREERGVYRIIDPVLAKVLGQ
jgi:AAA+ ATPase superfamily predicted ATPase